MPIRSDYHMHTSASADSKTPMEDQIRAAIAAGMESICFTEHLDLDSPYLNAPKNEEESFFRIDYDEYRKTYLLNKIRHAGQIRIYFGLELGLNTACESEITQYLSSHQDFDFIIGSTHSSRGMDPYYNSFFEGVDADEAFRQYYSDALANVRTFHEFDSYGHLDYILRYGPAPADGTWIHREDGTPATRAEIRQARRNGWIADFPADDSRTDAGGGRNAADKRCVSGRVTAVRSAGESGSTPRGGSSINTRSNGNDSGNRISDNSDGGTSTVFGGSPCHSGDTGNGSHGGTGSSIVSGRSRIGSDSTCIVSAASPLIRRDATYYYEKYADLIDPILFELILRGIALEVNTSPLRKGFPEPNPGRAVLRRYHDFGGRLITIGADAHDPGGVAYGFDRAADLLIECGFTEYATYEGRTPVMHEL